MKSEQQLDLIAKKPQHGGARAGAGRKQKRPTKAIRVPVEYESALKHVVAFLDSVQAGEADLYDCEHLSDEIRVVIGHQEGKFSAVFEPLTSKSSVSSRITPKIR